MLATEHAAVVNALAVLRARVQRPDALTFQAIGELENLVRPVAHLVFENFYCRKCGPPKRFRQDEVVDMNAFVLDAFLENDDRRYVECATCGDEIG